MTEKGHWCGVVKWSPTKQQRPFTFVVHMLFSETNELLFTDPSDLENLGVDLEVRVLDRALGISKHVITDASVKCWANPVRTSCPTDRNATTLHTSIPSAETAAAVWGHIYAPSIFARVMNKELKTKYQRHHLKIWKRNIHSLLTLAAEPSEPNEGAAVQPLAGPVSQGLGGGASRPDLGP